MNAGHASGEGRRNLDGSLVGLDLDQRRVLGDHVALADEDLDDLGLGQALTKVGQRERPGHASERESVARGRDDA